AFSNPLLAVVLARVQLEQRPQELRLHDGVAFDRELADSVPFAFGDRDAQLDPPGLLVLRILEDLHVGLADARRDVPAIAVVLNDFVRVFLELRFLIRATAADEGEPPLLLVLLHLPLQGAVRDGLRSEEHTSELQSLAYLVSRLL